MVATKKKRIAVRFGGVSIGENTARIGIKIDREDIELSEAEEILCGRRLTGSVKTAKTNEDPTQKPLNGMGDTQHEIKSVFDVKRIGVSPKDISAGLTFALSEIPMEELAHFSKRAGWLTVDAVAELEVDDDDDED